MCFGGRGTNAAQASPSAPLSSLRGMAYAKLASLDVQFGLYSSFMGPLMYWLFGTSKDVSIGVRHPLRFPLPFECC